MKINKEIPSKEELEVMLKKDEKSIMSEGRDEYSNVVGQTDDRIKQVVGGWESAEQVANSLWSSIHESLLFDTDLVFAYKSTKPGVDISQVVVVQHVDPNTNELLGLFSVGIMTSGFTALVPKVPIEYLEKDVVLDMEKYKVEKNYIETFKEILKRKNGKNL